MITINGLLPGFCTVLTFIVLELVQLDTGHVTRTHHHQYQGKFIDTYHV